MMGHIDLVTPEGLVSGWCWNDKDAGARVHVTILVDGVDMGSTLASQYREDLKQAGVGDGRHAFQLTLNQFPFANKREQRVTLVDTATRSIACPPFILRSRASIGFDERIEQLEARSRLLETRLAEAPSADGDAHYAQLFSVVGNFFANLAQNVAQGRHLGADQKLDAMLKGVASTFEPLHFAEPERHALTILIEASAPLRQLHTCLARLKAAKADAVARIVVLDTGLVDEVALLPTIVRGIGYVRVVTDLCVEWAAALRAERAEFVLLLSGRAAVGEGCIEEMLGTFRDFEAAGGVGGCAAAAAGGAPRHGGLCLQGGALVDCARSGHPEPGTDTSVLHPVHALSHAAACFRVAALRHVGGLDDAYGNDLGAAVVDLCLRLHRQGWSLLSQPLAGVSLQPSASGEDWMTRALQLPSRAGDLLRGRWLTPGPPVAPLRAGPRALVVGRPDDGRDDLAAALHLQQAGHAVTYVAAVGGGVHDLSPLRRIGVSVLEGSEAAAALIASPGLLIFAAGRMPLLRRRAEDSTLLIGLRALKRAVPVAPPPGQAD